MNKHNLTTQLLAVVRTTFRTRKATASEIRKTADLMCGLRRAPDFTEQQLSIVINEYRPAVAQVSV